MNAVDAEIQIAILKSVEDQANATATALERVLELARRSVEALGAVEREADDGRRAD